MVVDMTRLFLTLTAVPVVVAVSALVLCWRGFSMVVWRLDKAIDDLFEGWM